MKTSSVNDRIANACAGLLDRLEGRWGNPWPRRIRLGLAAVLVVAWAKLAFFGLEQNALRAAGSMLFANAFLVSAAILFAPTAVVWVAAPFTRFVDSVYLGSGEIEIPPLNWEPVDRALEERRWRHAAHEFDRIAQWHAKEMRAYFDGIMCARLASDASLARELYRRGVVFFPQAENILRHRLEGPVTEVQAPSGLAAPVA